MPKNRIEVIDNTSGGIVRSKIRTVYIPGPSTLATGEQVLCTNTAQGRSATESSLYYNQTERGWTQDCLSFRLAEYLIDNYGFHVIYEGIGTATKIPASSWKKLKYTEFDLDYITTGQFGYIDRNAITVAYSRKDCTYLADHTKNPLPNIYYYFQEFPYEKTAPADWTTTGKYFVKISTWEPLKTKTIEDVGISFLSDYYYTKDDNGIFNLINSKPEDWGAWTTGTYTGPDANGYYTSTKYGILNEEGSDSTATNPIINGYEKAPSNSAWGENVYYIKHDDDTFTRVITEPEHFDSADYYIAFKQYNTSGVSYAKRFYYTLKSGSNGNLIDTSAYVSAVREEFEYAIGQDSTNSPYAAGFTPWFYSNIDTVNALDSKEVPASFGYLFAYGTSIKTNPLWFASAGPDRGVIPELVSPVVNYNRLDVEVLQARSSTVAVDMDELGDNVGVSLNPIANIRPFGIILYGNRTLRYNQVDAGGVAGELKASSFLNIRNLVSLLASTAKNAAERYKFDQNGSLLWTKFTSVLIPVLDDAVAGSGILGYSLKQQVADKKARLKAKLTVIPIEAVEDLDLTIELTDSLDVNVTGE